MREAKKDDAVARFFFWHPVIEDGYKMKRWTSEKKENQTDDDEKGIYVNIGLPYNSIHFYACGASLDTSHSLDAQHGVYLYSNWSSPFPLAFVLS